MEKGCSFSGYGLGLRPPHYSQVTTNRPRIDFFEIISENFMTKARGPLSILESLRDEYPIAMHGVSLSIGSKEKISVDYLERLKDLADFLKPAFVSDHLCFTQVGHHNSHDLLPLSLTDDNLKNISERIDFVQNYLGRRVLLENPSVYVAYRNDEFTEFEFFNELVDRTGCGILLDINNLFVNQFNLGVDARHYVANLNKEAIGYFHLSGHTQNDSVIIDTHDQPVCAEVWTLYSEIKGILPEVPVLLEWDDNIPTFDVLVSELGRARVAFTANLGDETIERIKISNQKPRPSQESKSNSSEVMLFESITGPVVELIPPQIKGILSDQTKTSSSHGFMVYHNAYYVRITSVMKEIYPACLFIMEEEGFSQTVYEYLQHYRPHHYSVTWAGQYFSDFLKKVPLTFDFGVAPELLSELARLEWLQVESFHSERGPILFDKQAIFESRKFDFERSQVRLDRSVRVFDSKWNIVETFLTFQKGMIPSKPKQEDSYALIFAPLGKVVLGELKKSEYLLINSWIEGSTVLREDLSEDEVHQAATLFSRMLNLNLITEIV
jgi:uncharacterized protein (UPF0276 family)